MARTVYVTTFLTGGGSGLDGIDGNNILAGDIAFFVNKTSTTPGREGNYYRTYMATTRSSTEESPEIILPDANAGDWNWEALVPMETIKHTTGKTATLENYGVSILRTTAATVHTLRRPRRGTKKTLVFASTSVIKVRVSTAAEAYTVKVGTTASIASVIIFTSRVAGGSLYAKPTITLLGQSTKLWRITSLFPYSTNQLKFSSST